MNPAVTGAMQGCCFGTATEQCGDPAVVHVLLDDAEPTMSCAEHARWWDAHPYVDRHPIMAVCGMPGSTWVYSWAHPDGRCMVEGLGDLSASEAATQRQEADPARIKLTLGVA